MKLAYESAASMTMLPLRTTNHAPTAPQTAIIAMPKIDNPSGTWEKTTQQRLTYPLH